MKDTLKFAALLGIAGFLLKDQILSLFSGMKTAPAVAPDPKAPIRGVAPIDVMTKPAPATPIVVAPSAAVDDVYLQRAATNPNWAPDAKGTRLTIDAWNWYANAYRTDRGLEAMAFESPEAILPAGSDRNTPITAEEYHQFRQAKGLSGRFVVGRI